MLSTELATRNSSRSSLVRPTSRAIQIDEPCRLLLVTVLLVALISAQEVSAASVSAAPGINAAHHHCQCETRCRGESCCCKSDQSPIRPPAPEPAPKQGRTDASPCQMTSAPCGNSGLPSAPSGRSVGKSAALAISEHPQLDPVGMMLPFSTPCLFPSQRASRLDRPPERLILA